MKIRNGLIPGVIRLARRTADISREAQRRVKWFDYYEANGHNARKTCRHFDISPYYAPSSITRLSHTQKVSGTEL